MLEILKISENKLQILNRPEPNCWINASNPSEEDIITLRTFFDIPEELLTSLKDIDEVPILEDYPNFTFIIIRAPYNNLQNDLEYFSVPVGIFINKHMVLTLSYFDNDVIPKLKTQRFEFHKTQLAFRLLLIAARLYLTYLNEIKKKMYALENQLEQSQKNKIVLDLLDIEKSLVYFSTSLKSNEILVNRIARDKSLLKTPADRKMIADVADENLQAIEMTHTYSSILGETLDAFASVISNNLNIVMKILAVLTIVISLPTLVVSIYGMNIPVPFQSSPHIFPIVMGVSGFLGLLSIIFFWRMKFF